MDDDYEVSDEDDEESDGEEEDEDEEEEDVDDSETIQMFDIGDLDEPFLPMPSDELVVPLKYCKNNLEKLLKKIPEIFKTHTVASLHLDLP